MSVASQLLRKRWSGGAAGIGVAKASGKALHWQKGPVTIPRGLFNLTPVTLTLDGGQQVGRSAAVFSLLLWLLGQGGRMALILEESRLELSSGVPAGCGFVLCF